MKKFYIISLLSIFSLNLFCQTNWTKYAGNPVMVPGTAEEWDKELIFPTSVVYFDSLYHMYYSGGNLFDTIRIGLAISQDGLLWTKSPSNPVLGVGPEGAWDERNAFAGKVLIIDSVFHMWFTGHEGGDFTRDFRIGHATSPDGVNWTKDAANPILDMGTGGSWDDKVITVGAAVFDGTTYHLWYGGIGPSGIGVGHATSPDAITWTKDPSNPVFSPGSSGSWDYPRIDFPSVIFDGTIFHMWYTGGVYFAGQIGYAFSEDGSHWEKYIENPVLRVGPEGSWDESGAFWCTVIDSANMKYKMWYSGGQMEFTGSIGYAESMVPAWKQMISMDIARGGAVSCVIDSMIYVFGGTDKYTQSVNNADVYNTLLQDLLLAILMVRYILQVDGNGQDRPG
jgi:hypothetical protein